LIDIGHQIEARQDELEALRIDGAVDLCLAECFDAGWNGESAFTANIDGEALPDAPAAIFPTERNVKDQIKNKETLAAFWRAPDDNKPFGGDDVFYQVGAAPAELERARIEQRKLIFGLHIVPIWL
jgi:hypothetical protein